MPLNAVTTRKTCTFFLPSLFAAFAVENRRVRSVRHMHIAGM
jgi:hypothetical protein